MFPEAGPFPEISQCPEKTAPVARREAHGRTSIELPCGGAVFLGVCSVRLRCVLREQAPCVFGLYAELGVSFVSC